MVPRWSITALVAISLTGALAGLGPGAGAGETPEAPCVKAIHHDVDTGEGQSCESYVCIAVIAHGAALFPTCDFDVDPVGPRIVIQPVFAQLVSPIDFFIEAAAVRLSDNQILECPPWELSGMSAAPFVGLPPCDLAGDGPWHVRFRIDRPIGTPIYGTLAGFAGDSPLV